MPQKGSPIGPFPGLIENGNVNLEDRPLVRTPEGDVATVRSMSFQDEDGGPEILVPTVGPNGELLSNREAIELYRRTGQNLGKFASPEDADRYAIELHNQQARYYQSDIDKLIEDHMGIVDDKTGAR
jgi:hypothetical protein